MRILFSFVVCCYLSSLTSAQILRTDGTVIPGTEQITPGPGMIAEGFDLSAARLSRLDLTDASFRGSDLTNASLLRSTITGVDFTDSRVNGTSFPAGFSAEDLYSTASYREQNLEKLIIEDRAGSERRLVKDISGWELSNQDLVLARFHTVFGDGVQLENSNVSRGRLDGTFINANFGSSNFQDANFTQGSLINSIAVNANFAGSQIRSFDIVRSDMSGSIFDAASVASTAFTKVNLRDTTWAETRIFDNSFRSSDLRGSVWNGTKIGSSVTFIATDFRDATFDAAGTKGGTDFTLADFRGATLNDVAWYNDTFTLADFSNTTIRGSYISGDLIQTNLSSAKLFDSLIGGIAFGANMTGADLSHASLVDITRIETVDLDGARYNEFTQFPDGFDPVQHGMVFEAAAEGDLNGDRVLDSLDVDAYRSPVRGMIYHSVMDLNGDGEITGEDRLQWVREVANTWAGDANFDGRFDSTDFVQLFQRNKYEDRGIGSIADWSDGDFDGNGYFNSADMVLAFQDSGYEQGPRPALQAVPEPKFISAWIVWLLLLVARRMSAR
ncbi:pentapeptide repeat-containing protein [Planctomycetota bacterium]